MWSWMSWCVLSEIAFCFELIIPALSYFHIVSPEGSFRFDGASRSLRSLFGDRSTPGMSPNWPSSQNPARSSSCTISSWKTKLFYKLISITSLRGVFEFVQDNMSLDQYILFMHLFDPILISFNWKCHRHLQNTLGVASGSSVTRRRRWFPRPSASHFNLSFFVPRTRTYL